MNVNIKKIPTSNYFNILLKKKKLKKLNCVSNGDDYQILYTADKGKARIIKNISKITGIKISNIGKIISGKNNSRIIDEKGRQIEAKSEGHLHQF